MSATNFLIPSRVIARTGADLLPNGDCPAKTFQNLCVQQNRFKHAPDAKPGRVMPALSSAQLEQYRVPASAPENGFALATDALLDGANGLPLSTEIGVLHGGVGE